MSKNKNIHNKKIRKMKVIDAINNVILFPFMILMGLFFGTRYIVKEIKYFFKEKKQVNPVVKMKNNVIALICGLITLTMELSLSLLNYVVHSQSISKDQKVLDLVKRLEALTANSVILIAICIAIIVIAYTNIVKERTKRRNFLKFTNGL